MEKTLNRANKSVRQTSTASAWGGILKLLQWIIWGLAKLLSYSQVELTKLDGSIDAPDSPKKVYRDAKDEGLSETNDKIAVVAKKLDKIEPRIETARSEAKVKKYERLTDQRSELRQELRQLNRVMKALRKKS